MIKVSIEARDGESVQLVLGPKDSFDSRALVHGAAGENFVAGEETFCFLIPRDVVLSPLHRNSAFAAFFTPTFRASSMFLHLRLTLTAPRYSSTELATIEHQRIEVAAMYY